MPQHSPLHTPLSAMHAQQYSLQALVPEQLIPYVQAVSAATSYSVGNFLVHENAGHATLVAYDCSSWPAHAFSLAPDHEAQLHLCIQHLQQSPHIEHITVLAPLRPPLHPHCTPHETTCYNDAYYFLPLPLEEKNLPHVLSMCRRALAHLRIEQSQGEHAWTGAHQELMLHYVSRQGLSKEMSSIFQRVGMYCRNVAQARLFSAYDVHSGALMGCTVADFTSLHTAFYMFAFRHPKATPGTAEALLMALLQEAAQRGYGSCNLGLGIHSGIRFFKEKWGAQPLLPLVQSSWRVADVQKTKKPSHWLARLFS